MSAANTFGGEDKALATLLSPFATGALAWPDARVLFVNARDGWPLHAVPRQRIVCVQDFKPHAHALQRGGLTVESRVDGEPFPLVLFLPPRQRIQARAELARAVQCASIGGIIVASIANNEGARSGEADMQRLLGPVQSMTKNHCRVFWTRVQEETLDRALLDEWSQSDAPRPIADGRFVSRPGVFAWDRIDAASELLASRIPEDLSGSGADLGAGFGYLSTEVLARCPRVTSLDLYEADARALELARQNLSGANAVRAGHAELDFLWHDVAAGLPRHYDFIVTNPPFHVGRADEPQLGRAFIAAAADALDPRGRLWLVANRHLPYESILDERFATVRAVTTEHGFKVIEATMAHGSTSSP
ncbi:MAG TPA: class I SAM-dependent methyltransferase [Xanthomonadaceae bacterium]|nr:class I SAM-dependent methyltransferase [Xanthomonadaceae bacterium]